MESVGNLLAKKRYLPKKPNSFEGLPVRESVRNTRAVIDNEYFSKGYAALFKPKVTAIYLLLAKYANQKTQTCFPSIELIRKESGVKNRNNIMKALTILAQYQLIYINHSGGDGSNYYALLKPEVWKPIGSVPTKPVSKTSSTEYQKPTVPSNPVDTLNQITKSVNKINKPVKEINIDGKKFYIY